ncbi:MAG: gamma carbonic anhydrase family protein [Leptospiraceae bacterium]|nr:gamma carbonic anhydrase family protein [Leptospiraceae bacterium]
MIWQYKDQSPQMGDQVFIAPNACVIGDVHLGDFSNIWFGCVLRGDVHSIHIGQYCNIQDQSLLHVTGGQFPLNMGNYCTLGHKVLLHGCTLADYAFIGMGAMVMDGARVGSMALVAAGSMVTPGKEIPDRCVAMGRPAQVVREITAAEEAMIQNTPQKYFELAQEYKNSANFFPLS